MKVKQLIKHLEGLDPEANVYIGESEYESKPIRAISLGMRLGKKSWMFSGSGVPFMLKGYFDSPNQNVQKGIVDVQLNRAKIAREDVVLKDVLISATPNPDKR